MKILTKNIENHTLTIICEHCDTKTEDTDATPFFGKWSEEVYLSGKKCPKCGK